MTLETIAAGILAIGSYMWIPYDPQPLDVQQEYYASTEAVSASSLHYFNSRPLAEKVRREAHALLACKWTPSGYVDVYNSGLAYHLINSDVTFANRMILADLFADYIIGEGDL